MTHYAVILAGGTGSRAGGDVPKQFHEIAGRPLLWWSLRAFREVCPDVQLVLVIHPDWREYWETLMQELPVEERFECSVTSGGRDRVESVANALAVIPCPGEGEKVLVAVHDGARCCVSAEVIKRGWDTAEAHDAAVPAVAVTDSLRMLDGGGKSHAVERSRYVAVQTPQVFDLALLRYGFEHRDPDGVYTDDASIVEPHHPITLFEGDPNNIKVTNPGDFSTAHLLLEKNLKF